MVTDKSDYPYVRAWGKLLGSFHYYVREQVEQARADAAPANATHRRVDGTWATTDDVTRPETRRQLGLEPLPLEAPVLARIAALIRNDIQYDDELLDRYGLTDVTVGDKNELSLRFATGWTARLTLELQAPEQPA